MSLRFEMALQGKLKERLALERRTLAQALAYGVRQTTFGLRNEIRRQVRKGGLARRSFGQGSSLESLIRGKVARAGGDALDPQGTVYSRATYAKRPGGIVDLAMVFDRGATIVPARDGKQWLAIPTANAPFRAGRGGVRKATPFEAGINNLVFIPSGRGGGIAFLIDKATRVLMYVLLRQATIRKTLDIAAADAKWLPGTAERIRKAWGRLAGRAGL